MSKFSRTKKAAASIPPLKKYLNEKIELGNQVNIQKLEINSLNKRIDNLAYDLNLLKGIIPGATEIRWPVFKEDIIKTASPHSSPSLTKKKPPYHIVWVIPPMGSISGGHTDIFRIISFLESRGHTNTIYFYDAMKLSSLNELKTIMQASYPKVSAKLFYNQNEMEDCDAIFATSWVTAYPVLNYPKQTKKYYFVQDFEPMFEATGSYSTLAENTYSFGFHGVTLGDWLKEKLTKEFDMTCDSLSFGVNVDEYTFQNEKTRKDVLFYARPSTPRRGFEMGTFALEIFHKNNPNSNIHLFGWDVGNFKLDFPYKNHGILNNHELNNLYNECAAGLVLSFTNMSLLPIEMLAAGCMPIVNDAHHTHMVSYSKYIEYAKPNPKDLATKLEQVILSKNLAERAKSLAKTAREFQWDSSISKLEKVLIRDLS